MIESIPRAKSGTTLDPESVATILETPVDSRRLQISIQGRLLRKLPRLLEQGYPRLANPPTNRDRVYQVSFPESFVLSRG